MILLLKKNISFICCVEMLLKRLFTNASTLSRRGGRVPIFFQGCPLTGEGNIDRMKDFVDVTGHFRNNKKCWVDIVDNGKPPFHIPAATDHIQFLDGTVHPLSDENGHGLARSFQLIGQDVSPFGRMIRNTIFPTASFRSTIILTTF